jgi:hypothetical protein
MCTRSFGQLLGREIERGGEGSACSSRLKEPQIAGAASGVAVADHNSGLGPAWRNPLLQDTFLITFIHATNTSIAHIGPLGAGNTNARNIERLFSPGLHQFHIAPLSQSISFSADRRFRHTFAQCKSYLGNMGPVAPLVHHLAPQCGLVETPVPMFFFYLSNIIILCEHMRAFACSSGQSFF